MASILKGMDFTKRNARGGAVTRKFEFFPK